MVIPSDRGGLRGTPAEGRWGVALKEIADVLRHHNLETTLVYTKVDLPMLAGVALPWSEVKK